MFEYFYSDLLKWGINNNLFLENYHDLWIVNKSAFKPLFSTAVVYKLH